MSSSAHMINFSNELVLGCLDNSSPSQEENESELPEINISTGSKLMDTVNKNETKNKAILLYTWLDSLLDFPQSDTELEKNNVIENPKSGNIYEKTELILPENVWDIWNGKSLDIKFLGPLESFPIEYPVKDRPTGGRHTPINRPVVNNHTGNNSLHEKTTDSDNPISWDLWQGNTMQLHFRKHDLQKRVKPKSQNLRTDWLRKRHLFPPVGSFFGHTGADCSCHTRTSRPLFKRQEVSS